MIGAGEALDLVVVDEDAFADTSRSDLPSFD